MTVNNVNPVPISVAFDSAAWIARREALIKTIDALQARITVLKGNSGSNQSFWGMLGSLTQALRDFSIQHINFFIYGFTNGSLLWNKASEAGAASRQPMSIHDKVIFEDGFSPDYVLREVMNTVAHDVRMVEMLIAQSVVYEVRLNDQSLFTAFDQMIAAHSAANANTASLTETELVTMLNATNRLHAMVLALVDHAATNIFNKTKKASAPSRNALTYFERTTTIRVVPYLSVILIGVPYTAIQHPSDLLALYHESGHTFFWQALTLDDRKQLAKYADNLAQKYAPKNVPLDDRYRWLSNWIEEIFADTFGVITGKAAMLDKWLTLVIQDSDSQLLHDDGQHPPPFLRTKLCEYLLCRVMNTDPKSTPKYDQFRAALANRRGLIDDKFGVMGLSTGLSLSLHDVYEGMQALADRMFDLIQPQSAPDALMTTAAVGGTVGKPGFQFSKTALTQLANTPAEQVAPKTWQDWLKSDLNVKDNILKLIVPIRDNTASGTMPATPIDYDDWFRIFAAGGWTTEGPHSQPSTVP